MARKIKRRQNVVDHKMAFELCNVFASRSGDVITVDEVCEENPRFLQISSTAWYSTAFRQDSLSTDGVIMKKKSKSKFRWKRENYGKSGVPAYAMSITLRMFMPYNALVFLENDLNENPKGLWTWDVSTLRSYSDGVVDEYVQKKGTARTKEEAMQKCEDHILKDIDKRILEIIEWRRTK